MAGFFGYNMAIATIYSIKKRICKPISCSACIYGRIYVTVPLTLAVSFAVSCCRFDRPTFLLGSIERYYKEYTLRLIITVTWQWLVMELF